MQFNNVNRRLATLIDADNAWASMIEPLLKEIANYGTANVKRIYGDWTSPQLGSWKDKLNKFAIQPIQQFNYTQGKNATDSALIIDAMDLLYTDNFDGFCIVSSDSDFTRLACRLRESGLAVYGFGEKKTPEAFQKACDKFTFIENLDDIETKEIKLELENDDTVSQGKKFTNKITEVDLKLKQNKELIRIIKNAYDVSVGENGWAYLALMGTQLNKLSSSFDSRNFGYKQLNDLIRAIGIFEIKEFSHDEKNPAAKALYIRLKDD